MAVQQAAIDGVMSDAEASGAFGSSTERYIDRDKPLAPLPPGAVLHDVHVKFDR